MKLYILGSCSGTEPEPGRRHTAIALETDAAIYWFDAGEGCSHTAHVMGLDLTRVEKIVISHPHMDHVGGFINLLWNIRKLRYVNKRPLGHDIDVWVPSMATWDGAMMMLNQSEGGFMRDYEINCHRITDGQLFGGEVTVTAAHNLHLGEAKDGEWASFSFRIQAHGKTIVFSGDCANIDELAPWLDCDILLMETGHHDPAACAAYLTSAGYNGVLAFVHHGRAILGDPQGQLERAKARYGGRVLVTCDGQILVSGEDF